MTKITKAQPKVHDATTCTWPATIDLKEKMPLDHVRAGDSRYGLIGPKGEGLIDRMTMLPVLQTLVDAAREREIQTQDA